MNKGKPMELDKIKDIIVARWKFIASNAAMISNIAQAMGESKELNRSATARIDDCISDINVNLASLDNILDGLSYGEGAEKDEIHD